MGTTPNTRQLLSSSEVDAQFGIERSTLHYLAARYKITNYGDPGRALWCPKELQAYLGSKGDPPSGYVSTAEAAVILHLKRSQAWRILHERYQPTTFIVNRGQKAQMWLRSNVESLHRERREGEAASHTPPGRPMFDDGEDDWIPEGTR